MTVASLSVQAEEMMLVCNHSAYWISPCTVVVGVVYSMYKDYVLKPAEAQRALEQKDQRNI